MVIKFSYFGISTPILSQEKQEIELPAGATVEQLVYSISDRVEDAVSEILSAASFIVNNIGAAKDTVLHDEDDVIILYAIGGG